MILFEQSAQVWAQMSADERALFLNQLQIVVKTNAAWLEVPAKDWAAIDSFNRLPSDLRGRLMMSVTSAGFSVAGFSVERYMVCQEVLNDHIRKEAAGK
ncbi:MAG: hypothetical protein AAB642_02505 [Patescibacteria group bacterium]